MKYTKKINDIKNQEERRVAQLLKNLGFTFVAAEIILDGSEFDSLFFDPDLMTYFLVEVTKKAQDREDKIIKFFEKSKKGSTHFKELNTKLKLKNLYQWKRVYFEISGGEAKKNWEKDFSYVLTKNDLEYYERIFNAVGAWAKNDFLSLVDAKPKSKRLEQKDAIVFGLAKDLRAYVYADSAKNLLRYSYVYRRKGRDKGYQRMIQKTRVDKIKRKILDNEILAFPNAIILSAPPKESVYKGKALDLSELPHPVPIQLPNDFSSCRIIDGQHRLSGFANTTEQVQEEHFMPVIILEEIEKDREVQTFIEINSGQIKITKNLIYALEADFNWEPKDKPKQFFQGLAVKIAEELNLKGYLKDKINIPDVTQKVAKNKIQLNTFVTALTNNKLIGEKNGFFQKKIRDIEGPVKKVNSVFGLIQKAGKLTSEMKGFLFSNQGVRLLFRLIQIYERNRLKKNITITLNDFVADVVAALSARGAKKSFDSFYGEGGANRATQEAINMIKEANQKKYSKFVGDLRALPL